MATAQIPAARRGRAGYVEGMTARTLYQIDAFTDVPLGGNPAAVVPLDAWLPDAVMQAIALENNLSETAFIVPDGGDWAIRWFTPAVEVDLCGHATLASAWALFEKIEPGRTGVTFASASGPLIVAKADDGLLEMDFPGFSITPAEIPPGLADGLGAVPTGVWRGGSDDLIALFDSADAIRALTPDFSTLAQVEAFGIVATAPGDDSDIASRYFAPRKGVNEDPVTGRAHCVVAPFWTKRLGQDRITARQLSARGGSLVCTVAGDRVKLAGRCALYLEGTITV